LFNQGLINLLQDPNLNVKLKLEYLKQSIEEKIFIYTSGLEDSQDLSDYASYFPNQNIQAMLNIFRFFIIMVVLPFYILSGIVGFRLAQAYMQAYQNFFLTLATLTILVSDSERKTMLSWFKELRSYLEALQALELTVEKAEEKVAVLTEHPQWPLHCSPLVMSFLVSPEGGSLSELVRRPR
jgi:hypothetical protein